MQTGLYLSIRRDADAVASRAEMGTYRADQPDFTQCAWQTVQLCNASVRRDRFQLRQLFQNNRVGYIGIRAEIPVVHHRHQFNKSYIHRVLSCQICQRNNFIDVKPADQHRIDLDLSKTGIHCCFNPTPCLRKLSTSRDHPIFLFIQCIKADIQPVYPRLLQLFSHRSQQCSVCSKAKFANTSDGCNLLAQRNNIWLDKRLPTCNTNFSDPESSAYANCLQHLLLRQHILVPFFTHSFLRHAVTAAQITEFRHGKAQIGNVSVKRINHEAYSPFVNTIPFSLTIDNPQFIQLERIEGAT